MRLISITLDGFKTFARRTVIDFGPGMVGIVGPNGSGKSNIVDAFKWVLGETQAKDLRGARMEEVIYSGGSRSARATYAEVALLLDNSEGRLPIDYRQVEIRRRVERGGSSEYFLNGTRVRRRDLHQLLGSTGLLTDSYALINQHDIEHIVTCSPEDRRQLLEEAARVRQVKGQRTEAAQRMRELQVNLVRLEDVRHEIGPRLDLLREQSAAATEAETATRRLEVLRGSIVFEEWREARDAHRRAGTAVTSIQRRLEEAAAAAGVAEADYVAGRQTMEAAQNRRLARQQVLGASRLELQRTEHDLAMATQRLRGLEESAATAEASAHELAVRLDAVTALGGQLRNELEEGESELASVGDNPPLPTLPDPTVARAAAQAAESARKSVQGGASQLAAVRSRRQYLEESVERLRAQVVPAEARLAATTEALARATSRHDAAAAAQAEMVRVGAELEGLEALRPRPRPGLHRVAEVLLPEPGYEAALSAVLGPLVDAWAAPDEAVAEAALEGAVSQETVFIPRPGESATAADHESLAAHVRCESGFEWLARRLLAPVFIGEVGEPAVTLAGQYRASGLYRSGPDARVEIAARRHRLQDRLAELEPSAADLAAAVEAMNAATHDLATVRQAAAGRPRLDESEHQLAQAHAAEEAAMVALPALEERHQELVAAAAAITESVAEGERQRAAHGSECRRLEGERVRWRERCADVRRRLAQVAHDVELLHGRITDTQRRREEIATELQLLRTGMPALAESVAAARELVASAELESPEQDAELAAAARALVALEEARVESRLKAKTLEGNLDLARREVEMLTSRLEEIRARMPLGQAPEEVPGGKAREVEMRRLERRLEELGPVNRLAPGELADLEARCTTIDEQLGDIEAARADLDLLVARLREEEDTRYDAVFGAVAAGFQHFFEELTAGGRATLQHTSGTDGPRSGVEILVQPPRKRLTNVTLLSSGERSLVALALVLALEEVNPSPFMILDEVDAALDDANVGRYGEMLHRLGSQRQLLTITHNHVTMSRAAALYGVHLDESGRSSLVSVRLDDIRPTVRATA